MAQAEDTELRDLVIEALEKNGSLAKIRALLRANIFLAFEDECENKKQNESLDNILNLPEGALCCSIVHEFLEFCNLKNTLFVYKSESRQGRAYKYEGQKTLTEKINLGKGDCNQEPVLVSLIKIALQMGQLKYQNNTIKTSEKKYDNSYKDEQNCTYIVHEDSSSATCNSQSDNSSDEKNQLHLRLQLDNSDTDTSSDSARDKTTSEYIPSQHVIVPETVKENSENTKNNMPQNTFLLGKQHANLSSFYITDLKFGNNSSSDSTSYVELKPFTPFDEKLLNTTGVPIVENIEHKFTHSLKAVPTPMEIIKKSEDNVTPDSMPSGTMSSTSLKNESPKSSKLNENKLIEESVKSDAEYSYDFSSSTTPKKNVEELLKSPESVQGEFCQNSNKIKNDKPINSGSSHSSVSISDVTDLLSDKSYSHGHVTNDADTSHNKKSKINSEKKSSRTDDDSGDFSESPIPSLSNLSLDIHSD
ncbi:centrosomal protein 43-like [Plodia interpunctella]|uniref:centrosomal protein 43-like n=1 Tax=Plodia interpunctella TaxID=58824 RepID=UPI0023681ADF|nr:centrosomal protein 43-like [Plodia interpunctella]